jgi:hypothetical protein
LGKGLKRESQWTVKGEFDICLNKGGLSTPEKPKRSKISVIFDALVQTSCNTIFKNKRYKYGKIISFFIKLGVLFVFLWMQDLNGMVF